MTWTPLYHRHTTTLPWWLSGAAQHRAAPAPMPRQGLDWSKQRGHPGAWWTLGLCLGGCEIGKSRYCV